MRCHPAQVQRQGCQRIQSARFSSSPLLLLLLSVNSRHSINASRQTESLLSAAGLKVLPALPPGPCCGGALPGQAPPLA